MSFQKLFLFLGLTLITSVVLAYHVPNGFYISGGALAGMFGCDHLKTTDVKNIDINATADEIQLDLFLDDDKFVGKAIYKGAIGYAYNHQPFRFDLAYLKSGKFDYTANPLLKNNANPQYTDFKSKLNSSSAMLNIYFDKLNNYSRIMPYITAGIGYASNKIKWSSVASLTGIASKSDDGGTAVILDQSLQIFDSQKTNSLAWQVGIGSRFRILDNVFADLSIQHFDFGKVKWDATIEVSVGEPPFDVKVKQNFSGKIISNQVGLALTFFFGDQSEPPPSLITKI